MFLIRNATMNDFDDLRRLSLELDSVNLPRSPQDLRRMLRRSVQSFAGKLAKDKSHAQFVFVMEDTESGCVVGTCKIFARHGTPKKPHVYFQVMHETVSSKLLGVRFRRKYYRLKTDTRGYTEVGGLVLAQAYRKSKLDLGRQLSFIRFLFMKAYSSYFMNRVIAELLPPLREGQSTLWNCYGHKLTQLPYRKADLLSYKDKEFILRLFPKSDLYHDLLPPEVQADMEQTGPGSAAACQLLSKNGFRYAHQVDPFDGGPHYVARRNQISVYHKTERRHFGGPWKHGGGRQRFVMATDKCKMRALLTKSRLQGGQLYLPPESVELLSPALGKTVYTYDWRS